MDSLASLQRLPAGVAALIASSPAYFERFRYMTRGQQIQAVAKLTTSLVLERVAVPVGRAAAVLGGGPRR